MKNIILIASIILSFSACNSTSTSANETKSEETTNTNKDEKYSCPMHPEEIGEKGAECSKCGMELTEPVQ
jgi:hypothetical protein